MIVKGQTGKTECLVSMGLGKEKGTEKHATGHRVQQEADAGLLAGGKSLVGRALSQPAGTQGVQGHARVYPCTLSLIFRKHSTPSPGYLSRVAEVSVWKENLRGDTELGTA